MKPQGAPPPPACSQPPAHEGPLRTRPRGLRRHKRLDRVVATALLVVALIAVTGVSSCSLPTDEAAHAIDPEDLPESLRPGFTATTTMTAPAPLTEARTVYLLTNPQDIERTVVVPTERQVNRNATLAEVLGTLFGESTSTEEEAAGYFNTLELFEVASATVIGGVATIDIVPLSPEDLPPPADTLELVAAQLVYTASADEDVNGVRILLGGDEVSIPTSDADAEPGSVLTTSSYEQFQLDFAPAPTTTRPSDE